MSLVAPQAVRSATAIGLVLRKFFIAFSPLLLILPGQEAQAQLQKPKSRGEWIAEIRYFDEQLSKHPRDAKLICERGWRYQKIGLFDKAMLDYKSALAIKANLPLGLYYMGRWYDQQMMDDQALELYGKAIKADSKYLDAYNERARLHSKNGRLTLALADYNRALAVNPDDAHMLYKRCEVYLKMKRYKEAVVDIENSLRTRANHSEGWLDRGYCYAALGDFPKAVESFNKVEELEKGSEVLSFERAKAYHAMGKFNEAIKDLDRVLDVSPYIYDAYLNRSMAFLCLGNKRLAVKDLDYWMQKTEYHDDNVWLGVALAYVIKCQMGEEKKGKAIVQTALKVGNGPQWQKPIVQYLNNVISFDQLKRLIATYPNDRLTIARTLLGLERLTKDAPAEARTEFKWVLANGSKVQLMYQVAATQMKQLKSKN